MGIGINKTRRRIMDKFISTTRNFCDIIIAEANQLAAQHENDSQWDIWNLKKEFNYDPECQDCNQVER